MKQICYILTLVLNTAFAQTDSTMDEYQEQIQQWKYQKDSLQKGNSKKKQDFEDAKSFYTSGKDFEKKGELLKAIEAYEKSVAIRPMAKPFIQLAKAYKKNEQDAKAILNFDKALALPKIKEKDAMEALNGVISIHLAFKDYNSAVKKVEPFILQFPSNDQPYYLKGKILKESGREMESIAAFKKAIELDAKNIRAAYELANSLNKKEDYSAAKNILAGNIANAKDDSFLQAALYFEWAESCRGLSDKTSAIEYYKKASEHKKWKEFSEYWIQQLTP